MTKDIDWDEIAKIEMRPGAPERPARAVRTIASHTPPTVPAKPPAKRLGAKAKDAS